MKRTYTIKLYIEVSLVLIPAQSSSSCCERSILPSSLKSLFIEEAVFILVLTLSNLRSFYQLHVLFDGTCLLNFYLNFYD